jgi:hypothetical protein
MHPSLEFILDVFFFFSWMKSPTGKSSRSVASGSLHLRGYRAALRVLLRTGYHGRCEQKKKSRLFKWLYIASELNLIVLFFYQNSVTKPSTQKVDKNCQKM